MFCNSIRCVHSQFYSSWTSSGILHRRYLLRKSRVRHAENHRNLWIANNRNFIIMSEEKPDIQIVEAWRSYTQIIKYSSTIESSIIKSISLRVCEKYISTCFYIRYKKKIINRNRMTCREMHLQRFINVFFPSFNLWFYFYHTLCYSWVSNGNKLSSRLQSIGRN